MLVNKLINEKALKVILAGFIAYYFAPILMQSYTTAIGLLGLAVFLLIFLYRAEYAFYFILATRSIITVYLYNAQFAGRQIPQIIGLLFSVIAVFYIVTSKYNIFRLGVNKVYIWFILFSFLPVFFSESFTMGFGYWLRWMQGFLVLNMTVLILINAGPELYKKKIKLICFAVILSLVVPYILFTKNYIQGVGVVVGRGTEYIRYSTFGAANNVFSYYLLAVLPFCLFLYSVAKNNSKKILWLGIIAVILFTVYINYTRTVWFGVATLLVVWTIIKGYHKISLILIGLFLTMIVFNPTVQDRMEDLYFFLASDKGFFDMDSRLLNNRIGLWQANINYFLNESNFLEKLFGNGADALKTEVVQVIKTGGHIQGAPEHNNYLILLMNTGITGLFIYLIYILKLFQESFKLLRSTQDIYLKNLASIFIPVLCSYMIIGLATHTISKLSIIYYFSVFAGFIIAANVLEKEKGIEE